MKKILEEADRIFAERQESYDTPDESFSNIAAVWNVLARKHLKEDLTPEMVALMMAGLKLVRQTANPKHDNIVDVVGYMICHEDILDVKGRQ